MNMLSEQQFVTRWLITISVAPTHSSAFIYSPVTTNIAQYFPACHTSKTAYGFLLTASDIKHYLYMLINFSLGCVVFMVDVSCLYSCGLLHFSYFAVFTMTCLVNYMCIPTQVLDCVVYLKTLSTVC